MLLRGGAFFVIVLTSIAQCGIASSSLCKDIQSAFRRVADAGMEFYTDATPTGAMRVGDRAEFHRRARDAMVAAHDILQEIDQGEMGFHECIPDVEPYRTAAQMCEAMFRLLISTRGEARSQLSSKEPFGQGVPGIFNDSISWKEIIHSGWPVFRLAAFLEDETRQPTNVPLTTLQYDSRDEAEECTPEQEYFHQIAVLYAGEGRTVRLVDMQEFVLLWLQRDGHEMNTNGARLALDLLYADPLDDLRCRSSLAVAYIALVDSLQCHWHRSHSLQSHELADAFIDIAQRHATQSSKVVFTSRWPLLRFLGRLHPPDPESKPSPHEPRKIVVSWSSREAELGGWNWAESFVAEVFQDVPNVELQVDVECADIYVFRSKLPINFGGVLIFVDGESCPEDSLYDEVLARYPASIVVGPMPAGGLATRHFRVPYVSTSFASRTLFTPLDFDHPRMARDFTDGRHFAAYLAFKCWPHRERFYQLLDTQAQYHNLGRVHVLSRCGNTSTSETQRRQERYSATYFDDAVALFSKFRFAMVFENKISPRYVTEKIVNAFLAGAVPIYWGSPFVFRIFNSRSFIYVNSFDSFEAAVQHVVEVAMDSSKYAAYLEAPMLANTTDAPYYFSWHRASPPMRNTMPTLREDLAAAALELHYKGDSGLMPAIERRPWDYADVFSEHL